MYVSCLDVSLTHQIMRCAYVLLLEHIVFFTWYLLYLNHKHHIPSSSTPNDLASSWSLWLPGALCCRCVGLGEPLESVFSNAFTGDKKLIILFI